MSLMAEEDVVEGCKKEKKEQPRGCRAHNESGEQVLLEEPVSCMKIKWQKSSIFFFVVVYLCSSLKEHWEIFWWYFCALPMLAPYQNGFIHSTSTLYICYHLITEPAYETWHGPNYHSARHSYVYFLPACRVSLSLRGWIWWDYHCCTRMVCAAHWFHGINTCNYRHIYLCPEKVSFTISYLLRGLLSLSGGCSCVGFLFHDFFASAKITVCSSHVKQGALAICSVSVRLEDMIALGPMLRCCWLLLFGLVKIELVWEILESWSCIMIRASRSASLAVLTAGFDILPVANLWIVKKIFWNFHVKEEIHMAML